MDLYYEMLSHPVFTLEDVKRYYASSESAKTAVKRLMKKGRAVRIRRNLYTAISGETGAPVANRFQIAGAITQSSCISHHTAMEYYGITDQIFYDVYVSSATLFPNFTFNGYTYRFVRSCFPDGIDTIPYSGGVRITDRERTLLESIKDMDKISGIEEVIANIEDISGIREDKLTAYLALFGNQFLYQKTGYLLTRLNSTLGLSDYFFSLCRDKAGKSTRYLSRDYRTGKFNSEWKLVVAEEIFRSKNGM